MKTALVVIIFIILFGIAGRMDKEDAQAREQVSHTTWRVEEDSPFWNCAAMGNYQCGPVR